MSGISGIGKEAEVGQLKSLDHFALPLKKRKVSPLTQKSVSAKEREDSYESTHIDEKKG